MPLSALFTAFELDFHLVWLPASSLPDPLSFASLQATHLARRSACAAMSPGMRHSCLAWAPRSLPGGRRSMVPASVLDWLSVWILVRLFSSRSRSCSGSSQPPSRANSTAPSMLQTWCCATSCPMPLLSQRTMADPFLLPGALKVLVFFLVSLLYLVLLISLFLVGLHFLVSFLGCLLSAVLQIYLFLMFLILMSGAPAYLLPLAMFALPSRP